MSGRWVIGIDEAGYGPSMGPLVLGAVCLWVPDEIAIEHLSTALIPEIQPAAAFPKKLHIPIGDSKKIMLGKYGWANLSFAAEWLIAYCLSRPASPQITPWNMLPELISQDATRMNLVPWYQALFTEQAERVIPYFPYLEDADSHPFGPARRSAIRDEMQERVLSKLNDLKVTFREVQARAIDEMEFNRLVELSGNKSNVLSDCSLQLAKTLALNCVSKNAASSDHSHTSTDPIEIYCDKHGGRNRYQPQLMCHFDGVWFETLEEGPQISRYQGNWQGRELSIQFMAKGDSLFPSAAASILAKWTREICMGSLNQFWATAAGISLRPTAGYYVDATRFAQEIEATAVKLGLPRETWWRIK